jgi:hypothetical protein
MSTVGTMTAVAGLVLFALIVGFGLWAVRRQSRMFPKDFDRTGWNPERGHAGWFATRFAWLSGGRG